MKKGELNDKSILRVARIQAVQSATTAFVEVEHDTQLSIERGVIWQIHGVEFGLNIAGTVTLDYSISANTIEFLQFQLTKESQDDMTTLQDPAMICKYTQSLCRSAAIGTDTGPLYFKLESPYVRNFPIPIPYAAQNIYFSFDASAPSALTVQCRIFYTLMTVSDKYFFRVAQSLLS